MHGGKSRWWYAHPNYKPGRYSKFALAAREEAEARRQRKQRRIMRAVLRKLDAWRREAMAEINGGEALAR
jgi:hypothetical protein